MRTHQGLQKKTSVQKAILPDQALAPRPFAAQRKPAEDQRQQENKGLENTLGEFAIHNPDRGRSLPVQPKKAIGIPQSPPATQQLTLQRQERPETQEQRQQQRLASTILQRVPLRLSGQGGNELGVQKENKTGLSDQLKAGIENLSGIAMDDVKVHYNSPQPAKLQALAYTQGTDIHVAPGQEKHLPHEAWHVVQQKQGRVKSTIQTKGVSINNDDQLETEADVMGEKAAQQENNLSLISKQSESKQSVTSLQRIVQPKVFSLSSSSQVIQRYGDKMAVSYEDLKQKEIQQKEEIIELQTGIQTIYNKHKENKKQARDKLDQEYQTSSENLEQKQDYLIAALQELMYQKFSKKAKNLKNNQTIDFSNQIINAQKKKNEIGAINSIIKQELNNQANDLSIQLSEKINDIMKTRHDGGKTTDKAAWRSKIDEYARDYGRHAIADPIVQNYERGYKASGLDKKKIQQEWVDYCQGKQYTLLITETEENVVNVLVKPENNPEIEATHIATVYFDEKRFVKSAEIILNKGTEKEEIREVFKHRESGKEYVQDAFNAYVKRYVKRALNKYDNPSPTEGVSINSDPRKKQGTSETWSQIAATIPSKTQDEKYQEIRNHQRAKELQGGSPFISFTTTDRPIFGSSAKSFEGEHGVATVDLAQVSKNRVFDTHTPKAIKQIHNVDDPNPDMPFVENSEAVERNSAARDAMRTRELVVAGDIPLEAITAVKAKGENYLKGPSGKFQPP